MMQRFRRASSWKVRVSSTRVLPRSFVYREGIDRRIRASVVCRVLNSSLSRIWEFGLL